MVGSEPPLCVWGNLGSGVCLLTADSQVREPEFSSCWCLVRLWISVPFSHNLLGRTLPLRSSRVTPHSEAPLGRGGPGVQAIVVVAEVISRSGLFVGARCMRSACRSVPAALEPPPVASRLGSKLMLRPPNFFQFRPGGDQG